MSDVRPDPDALLARVNAEERRAARGKLKIFFGANAGVGKTFAMLEAAQRRKAAGEEVVVGYVEPHGRVETERLLEGLERVPPLRIQYRGTLRHEFDLDAALARKPVLILVDELAHSNLMGGTPAPRHEKRWQDIEELRDTGIDVWTTVNVQHLESLNDIVAGITGSRQQETVPDNVFDSADEVELIDLPPDELLQRLHEGKVYLPDRVGQAVTNFFRKGNLIALRELALRTTANRVDAAMQSYRDEKGILRAWAARERLLVCIGPNEAAERVVRAGKRLADALDAEWIVVFVETPELLRLSEAERNRRIDVLRLAESLGAETVTLGGASVAEEVLQYARTRNVTRIVVGRTTRSRWRARLSPTPIARMLEQQRDVDVFVVGSDEYSLARRSPLVARTETMLGERKSEKRRWLCVRCRHHGCRNRDRLGDGAALRACEPDHGLPARGDDHRRSLRARSRGSSLRRRRGGVRFLLCPAAIHVRRVRRPVSVYLRDHADRVAGHRIPDRERTAAGARGRIPGTADIAPLRDEPRARQHTRCREDGAQRRAPHR